jgi:alkanesulfonate monooxygenase SsuD/methylene tetrahydromethanopterin reductase-like flavin-dependent oxidoreductase (luciferase family)
MSDTVETRGDDRVDVVVGDTNKDGKADLWAADTDGDGKPDLFQFDTDGDGKVDITMVDTTQDGTPDQVVDGVAAFLEAGIDEMIFELPDAHDLDTVALASEALAPLLRQPAVGRAADLVTP